MYVVAPRRAVLVSPRPTALSFFSRSQMDTAVFLTVQAISVKSSATPSLVLRRLERAQTRKCPSRSHGEHDCSAARPTVGSDMPLIRPVSFWPSSRLLPFSILQSFVDLIGRVLGSDLGQLHRFAAHRVLSNARATDSRVIFSLEGTGAPTGRGPRMSHEWDQRFRYWNDLPASIGERRSRFFAYRDSSQGDFVVYWEI